MRETHSDRRVTFAIVAVIFLSGIFFGVNFTNTSNNFLINTPPSNEDRSLSQEQIFDVPQDSSLLQNNDIQDNPSMKELFVFALEEINQDRKKHGLTPVVLGNNQAAQDHVEDMMKFRYFSHWNTNGVKPYVTYTELDGRAYVKENIAASWCEGFTCKMNPIELIEKFQYLMVYDDAESNWGHRDNILDPNHTIVNIGLAWDDNSFYFAQHFETKLIDFKKISFSNDKKLRISAQIPHEYSLDSISLFRDDIPLALTGDDLESDKPYNQNFYNRGTLAGIFLNEPQLFEFYEECEKNKISILLNNQDLCIPYETFGKVREDNSIDFEVDLSKIVNEQGIHTIYINLENQNGSNVIATSITLEYL